MSVLIKGMEMPPNCCQCPVNMEVCKRGYRYLLAHPKLYDKRADDCPLVEIPPHGRLIDADVAAKRGWTISRTYSASPTEMVYEAKPMTDEVLPTIIEAEEKR